METALIYCRVSTLHQNTERQLQELKEYCKRNDWKVIHEYSENISGTKSVKQRKHLIDVIGKHKPTHVVFHDYSRFSRNVKTALILKDEIHRLGVNLVTMQSGLHSLNADGTPNATANLVFTQLLAVYEMENATRIANIKSGIRLAKSKGVTLGRPIGTTQNRLKKYPQLVRLILEQEEEKKARKKYLSVRKMAVYTKRQPSLIINLRKDMREANLI
jgi:DNA invertase Pin-like site-specific DNA recombinase